jgi:hypothetical protein
VNEIMQRLPDERVPTFDPKPRPPAAPQTPLYPPRPPRAPRAPRPPPGVRAQSTPPPIVADDDAEPELQLPSVRSFASAADATPTFYPSASPAPSTSSFAAASAASSCTGEPIFDFAHNTAVLLQAPQVRCPERPTVVGQAR